MIFIIFLSLVPVAAQRVDIGRQGRNFDFSQAPFTRVIKVGDSLPPTCVVGDLFFHAQSAPGTNLRACTSTNVWTTISASSGGSGTIEIQIDGSFSGSRPKLNFLPGQNALLTCGDDPANNRVNCTVNLDSSLLNQSYARLNASNTFAAGVLQDFSAATLRIPAAAALAPTQNGYLGFDTNAAQLRVGRLGSSQVVALQNVSLQPLTVERNNASTTGTSLNLLAKLTGNGDAVQTATTDTQGAIGIVVANAGVTGTASIAYLGVADCITDNPVSAGNYVGIGSTTTGRCRDAGPTYPSSGQVIGRWLASASTGIPAPVLLLGPGHQGASGAGASTNTGTIVAAYPNATVGGGVSGFTNLFGSGFYTADNNPPGEVVTPVAGTLRNLYVRTGSAQGSVAAECGVWKNGADPGSLRVAIPANAAAGVFSNTNSTLSFAAGDRLTFWCYQASGGSALIRQISAQFN